MGKQQYYNMHIIRITFPDIPLRTRDGHKLRGFFGNLFREHSPLLHNHFEDGSLRYAYPLVQYKVIRGVANLIGINEGAELLADLFLKVKDLDIDGKVYPVLSKQIEHKQVEAGSTNDILTYQFLTPWLALSQKNYQAYRQADEDARRELLKRILRGNILSMYKGLGVWAERKLDAVVMVEETEVHFKGKKMIGFHGKFGVNAIIPDLLGIGRSVSRGFGTVHRK